MSILENIDRQIRVLDYLNREIYFTDSFHDDPDMESNYISMVWMERNDYVAEVRNYLIGMNVKPKLRSESSNKQWHISNIELRANYIEYEVRDTNGNSRHRYFSWELEIET